jgi:hypothetical protein
MAAIQKICEYSGDYPGWLMYGYKHNHIQIVPKYRKEFRGKKAVLYIQTKEHSLGKYVISYGGLSENLTTDDYKDRIINIDGKKYDIDSSSKQWHPVKVHKEFSYALVVPEMQGDVEGIYVNYSYNISAVKRRLKRMLRCKKLEVQYINEISELRSMDHSSIIG